MCCISWWGSGCVDNHIRTVHIPGGLSSFPARSALRKSPPPKPHIAQPLSLLYLSTHRRTGATARHPSGCPRGLATPPPSAALPPPCSFSGCFEIPLGFGWVLANIPPRLDSFLFFSFLFSAPFKRAYAPRELGVL